MTKSGGGGTRVSRTVLPVAVSSERESKKRSLTVRAGAGAAVGVVAKGVDVHASLGVGVVTGDVP